MEFRQLFDAESSTYTYLVADPETKEAALIDPVLSQIERDLSLIKDLGLQLKYALDTHVHADHITALGILRERMGCATGMGAKGGAACADLSLHDGDSLYLGALRLDVLETPGHTAGCVSYRLGDRVFTGDALLVRGCGRTDFQGGCAETLYDSITKKLFALPDATKVYPGHDYRGYTVSTIDEEKRLNPRLTKTKQGFVEFMRNLNLPNPKMMMAAVPANMRCGNIAEKPIQEPAS